MLSACSEEHREPPRAVYSESRAADSTTVQGADSTAADSATRAKGTISVDTAWAGEDYYDFDGNPTDPDGGLLITIPDDGAEGDAADAV